jgi:hypothetical protein
MTQRIAAIISLFMLLGTTAFSDPKTISSRDPILQKLKKALPAGWNVTVRTTVLRVKRKRPVWVYLVNRINAPIVAFRGNRLKGHPRKKIRPHIEFRIEKKWSRAQWKAADKHNKNIRNKLKKQVQLHRVGSLIKRSKLSKTGQPRNANAQEMKRWQDYQKALKRLWKRFRPTPHYQTTRLSLFRPKYVGFENAHGVVRPQKASRECYRVDKIVRQTLLRARAPKN